MQNDSNPQKKGSKRPLNDSSTPLSPMDEAAVPATATTYLNHGSSVRASKAARHDVNKLSYSPQMDKYLNPFRINGLRERILIRNRKFAVHHKVPVRNCWRQAGSSYGRTTRARKNIHRKTYWRYLRFFHGAPTKVFNVGNYRRELSGAKVGRLSLTQNTQSLAERQTAANRAMRDLKQWLKEKMIRGVLVSLTLQIQQLNVVNGY